MPYMAIIVMSYMAIITIPYMAISKFLLIARANGIKVPYHHWIIAVEGVWLYA